MYSALTGTMAKGVKCRGACIEIICKRPRLCCCAMSENLPVYHGEREIFCDIASWLMSQMSIDPYKGGGE